MSAAKERIVESAMASVNELGAMVRHYTNLVKAAKDGASPSQEVTDGLEADLETAKRDFAVGRRVLGCVLDAAGYDVRVAMEGDEDYFEISARKTEAELDKWREAHKEGVVTR